MHLFISLLVSPVLFCVMITPFNLLIGWFKLFFLKKYYIIMPMDVSTCNLTANSNENTTGLVHCYIFLTIFKCK